MSDFGVWQFRLSRALGRLAVRTAAIATLGRMPPFVSTSAIVVQEGQLLVILDPIRKEHVLPGGHLKWRETPEVAVVREVREETGYTVEAERLVGVFSGEEWADEPGVVRVIFEAQVVSGALASSAEGEARWIPVGEYTNTGARDAPVLRFWLGRGDVAGAVTGRG